ncbi:MAG: FAD-dependent oxidoreductase, partial [Chloroflexota bacterium]
KALLKVAKIAHEARTAADYGVTTAQPQVEMPQVREYVREAIAGAYQHETPEVMTAKGIDVIKGTAHFVDPHTLQVDDQRLTAKKFIISTGARPFIPPIPGLDAVPYITYHHLFEIDQLPERFLIIGAGPIGAEMAQAYQRLGSQVTLIDVGLLPREEPEVAEVMEKVFLSEGIQLVKGLVSQAEQVDDEIILTVDNQRFHGDKLLVAVGRTPNVRSLNLDTTGIDYSPKGIPVNKNMRTNVKHIYAVGDCVANNYQFTHVAGWQGFQAARNILLPLNTSGFSNVIPWTTFTDPEVAHVGLTEAEAREKWGDKIRVTHWPMTHNDRAIAENDQAGFVKVVHKKNGKVLGATIVAGRAGEMITEFAIATNRKLTLYHLANVIHPYPTYSVATMQLAGNAVITGLLDTVIGDVAKFISRWIR